jgi:hypothetical protein
MATHKSVGLALVEAPGNSKMYPNQLGGKVRLAELNYTKPAATTFAEGDTLLLTKLPKGARVIGVHARLVAFGANQVLNLGLMGADGSGVYDQSGTADDADFLIDADTVAAAGGEVLTVDLSAAGYLYETSKEVYVTLTAEDTASTTALAAGAAIKGYILYSVE